MSPIVIVRRRLPRVLLALALLAGACGSGNGLDEEARADLAGALSAAAAEVGLVLTTDGVDCAAEQLDDEAAAAAMEPADSWDDPTGVAVAEVLVSCVGSVPLMRAEMDALAPGLDPESSDCVAERLDGEVVADLIDDALRRRARSGPAVEVELSAALALCLSPSELLGL